MSTFASDLAAIRLIPIADDDERWKDVAPMTVLGNGRDAYVRESEWPEIREALRKAIPS